MTKDSKKFNKILITGVAGFIGFHIGRLLLNENYIVIGIDNLNNYYDVNLKKDRLKILKKNKKFKFHKFDLINFNSIKKIVEKYNPEIVIHLAAQAGIRHSIKFPESYIKSNIIGTYNLLESLSNNKKIKHVLIASTSSVYASNKKIPFSENDKADHQLSIYASSKKSTETISHSYSYTWDLPITVFRFFTVYGPWGRPDMALFKFTKNILTRRKIDLYAGGDMYRDFTYIDDLVISIFKLIKKIPVKNKPISKIDSISRDAPYRIVNIGNSKKVHLLKFLEIIEKNLKIKAKVRNKPMQKGDSAITYSNTNLLKRLINFKPETDVEIGVKKFIEWYKEYYKD